MFTWSWIKAKAVEWGNRVKALALQHKTESAILVVLGWFAHKFFG